MIVYSVTVQIDTEIEKEWLQWMKNKHIPDVMASGCFLKYEIKKLLDPIESNAVSTYNIQYYSPSMETLETYFQHYAPELQKEHSERYQNRFVAFRTILQLLES